MAWRARHLGVFVWLKSQEDSLRWCWLYFRWGKWAVTRLSWFNSCKELMWTDLGVKDNELSMSSCFHLSLKRSKMGAPPWWPNDTCPMPCLAALVSSAGEGQGRGLGKPGAATQLECVSAEELMECLLVWSMQRLWDMCEATLFTCIYLFAGIKLHSASLYPRPPLLFLDSLQKYLQTFLVSSPLPTISSEQCWPEPCCDFVSDRCSTELLGIREVFLVSTRNLFCCIHLNSEPRKIYAGMVFDNSLIIETSVWCFSTALLPWGIGIETSITALKKTLPCSFPVIRRANCDLNQQNPAWSPLKRI